MLLLNNKSLEANIVKGKKLSWYIFFLYIVFFIAWIFGNSRVHIIAPGSSYFETLLFFMNPNIFIKTFVKGEFLSLLTGAVSPDAFILIVSYLVATISFIAIIILAILLFVISWNTSIRQFHWISCCSFIPVLGLFFVAYFMLISTIHSRQIKKTGASKYDSQFEPEYFEEKLIDDLSDENLAKREKTQEFGEQHYRKLFHPKKTSFIKQAILKLTRYLA